MSRLVERLGVLDGASCQSVNEILRNALALNLGQA